MFQALSSRIFSHSRIRILNRNPIKLSSTIVAKTPENCSHGIKGLICTSMKVLKNGYNMDTKGAILLLLGLGSTLLISLIFRKPSKDQVEHYNRIGHLLAFPYTLAVIFCGFYFSRSLSHKIHPYTMIFISWWALHFASQRKYIRNCNNHRIVASMIDLFQITFLGGYCMSVFAFCPVLFQIHSLATFLTPILIATILGSSCDYSTFKKTFLPLSLLTTAGVYSFLIQSFPLVPISLINVVVVTIPVIMTLSILKTSRERANYPECIPETWYTPGEIALSLMSPYYLLRDNLEAYVPDGVFRRRRAAPLNRPFHVTIETFNPKTMNVFHSHLD